MNSKYRICVIDDELSNNVIPSEVISEWKNINVVLVSKYSAAFLQGFLVFNGLKNKIVIAENGKVIFKGIHLPPEYWNQDDNRTLEEAISFVESELI